MLLASILSFLAALLTLIAFAIDIALYVKVRDDMNHFAGSTHPGPGTFHSRSPHFSRRCSQLQPCLLSMFEARLPPRLSSPRAIFIMPIFTLMTRTLTSH
jgi:hypothetical protein